MIKFKYTLPKEEVIESSTRVQESVVSVNETDATLEMTFDAIKNLHDQNFDLDITIRVKEPT